MSEDWRAHFDFIQAKIGESATLTLNDGNEYDVTVIDERTGVEVLTDPGIMTLQSRATIRAYQLDDDVDLAGLDGATLMFADESIWTVISHQLEGSPSGPANGEIMLVLEQA